MISEVRLISFGAMVACLAVLLVAPISDATANGSRAAPLAVDDLDPAALDAARRYQAMPSRQAISATRHDPRAIAHRFEEGMPDGYMTDDQRTALIDIVTEEFSGLRVEHDETAIRVLAHVYTAEELDALVAFEQTEIGQQIAEKRPIYSVLIKDATARMRRDALARAMERFTGIKGQ